MMLGAIPAGAHGVHGSVPAVIGEQAGPYRVSLWIEYDSGFDDNQLVRASAEIEAESAATDPELWVVGADGLRHHIDELRASAGAWTVQFNSQLGDTLIISWTTDSGEHVEQAIAIDEMATPWYFQVTLIAITVPGLWFVMWLWRRRARVFSAPVMVQ